METEELGLEAMGNKVKVRDMLLYLFFHLSPSEQQEFWERFTIAEAK